VFLLVFRRGRGNLKPIAGTSPFRAKVEFGKC
jgi:hypothetical protein